MSNMIARLGVVLGLDTAEFNKGIEDSRKTMGKFVQDVTNISKVGALAFTAMATKAMMFADELADVAKANDVAIDSILKLQNGLQLAGGKAEDAGKILAAFTNFVDKAAEGSFEAQKAFSKAGISLRDLASLSTQQLLHKTVEGIAAIEDPLTRNAKAMDVFGKAAKGVDFVELNEQMQRANTLTDQQVKGIKDAAEAWDKLNEITRQSLVTFTALVGTPLKTAVEYIDEMRKAISNLGVIFDNVMPTIKDFFGATKAFLSGDIEQGLRILDQYASRALKTSEEFNRRMAGTSGGEALPTPSSAGQPPVRNVIQGVDARAEAARKKMMHLDAMAAANAQKAAEEDAKARAEFFAMYEKGNQSVAERQRLMAIALSNEKEMMLLEMKSANMRQEDYTLEREKLQIKQQLSANLEEIDNRRDLTAEARAQAEAREVALSERALAIAHERYQLTLQARQGTFEDGFAKSAMRFIRDMPTELEQGAKAFDSLMGNMESAIDRFVKTGKIGFKDLARSIIQDMLAMQMKAAASGFLSSLFGSMFGMKSNPYQPAAVMGFPGYADGGNPAVNSPSIVGERGPELFVPRTAGTIIPNHALAGVGGTTMVTNNYINAIDTKSFEQRLLGSPNAIWAANQYATKSLAVSRGRT